MADIDPLGIINSETHVGPDGIERRANEKVTRNYMQFGKYCLQQNTHTQKPPPHKKNQQFNIWLSEFDEIFVFNRFYFFNL
jgi:hypothetical protein